MMRERRCMHAIIYDVLNKSINGAKQTHIMYGGNLSFTQTKEYLSKLSDAGLISQNGDTWITTKKGLEYVKTFAEIIQMLMVKGE